MFMDRPTSTELATFNSSMARFGSWRSMATPARIVGSQYLSTSVFSGKVFSSSAASFSAPAGAEKLAAELEKTFPLNTLVERYWLPTIRAGVAMERQDPNRAIELLKVASSVELGLPMNIAILMCPVYLRGEAYLMLHDGNRAEAEFQKFIDHRGLVVNFPWGALARLGLARAYALQGDTTKARAAYQEFLTLWKD